VRIKKSSPDAPDIFFDCKRFYKYSKKCANEKALQRPAAAVRRKSLGVRSEKRLDAGSGMTGY